MQHHKCLCLSPHVTQCAILAFVINRVPFVDKIRQGWEVRQSLLCVGLDPDLKRLPERYSERVNRKDEGLLTFCHDIVDATADRVCAFKPQVAYFAARGLESQLADLIAYVHQHHADVPVILDAKRGDIGDTAKLYAIEAFERYDADAVTVNPYLGAESISPYLDYPDRGVIVLCRTSNPGSAWLQQYPEQGEPVYLRVARAAAEWNGNGNVMLVAGATYPEQLGAIRRLVGDMPLLVPGVGTQGGDLEAVLRAGVDSRGQGLIINASRSVLYADPDSPAQGAASAAEALRVEINRLLAEICPQRASV